MKRSGLLLVEVLVVLLLMAFLMNLIAVFFLSFDRTAGALAGRMEELATVERFLADWRADVRASRGAEVREGALVLRRADGERIYRHDPETGSVSCGGRQYPRVFRTASFRVEEDRVFVDVETIPDPRSTLHPRWTSLARRRSP